MIDKIQIDGGRSARQIHILFVGYGLIVYIMICILS